MKNNKKLLVAAAAVAVGGCALTLAPQTFAATNNTATINVTIGQTLSLKINNSESAETTNISTSNATVDETSTHVINVATNNPSGYTLTVIDQDTDNSLVRVAGSSIPATSATTLTATTPAWGIKVKTPGASDYGADYQAVPVSGGTALSLYTNDGTNITSSSFNEDTTVKIGVATGSVQAGTYTDTIVYQVTGNV